MLSVNVAGLGMSVAADAVTLTARRIRARRRPCWPAMRGGYLNLVRLVLSGAAAHAVDRHGERAADVAAGQQCGVAAIGRGVQTNNYASQLTGWRATYAGEVISPSVRG